MAEGSGWKWRKTSKRQRAGKNSQQIQGERIEYHVHNHTGLSMEDAIDLYARLSRADAQRYTEAAFTKIDQRVDEFLVNYFERQSSVDPDGLSSLEDPFMQRSLRDAQIEFATSGSEDLGQVLVDLLVQLSNRERSSLSAIALRDAIQIVPKLKQEHLNTLSVIVALRCTIYNAWNSFHEMYGSLSETVAPLANEYSDGGLGYRHMQGLGLGWFGMSEGEVSAMFLARYPGLFTKGINFGDIPTDIANKVRIIPALRDERKVQLAITSQGSVDAHVEEGNFTDEQGRRISAIIRTNLMSELEVKEEFERRVPAMRSLLHAWRHTSNMHEFDLTSTGFAIGHANLQAKSKAPVPLNVYIPQ
ncbi:LPO_1073/Vpar_1526 family protein [Nocardia sp. NPDC050697]|uniref:LPO_1073/Vpar_1526 family protein n=1 Tax=Nocardia sp. NPDC050697 TaxID=3155158 RepID=UPI0033D6DBF5